MSTAGPSQISSSPHVQHLDNLIERKDSCPYPTMRKVIKVARETLDISEETHLKWNGNFLGSSGYIDGISIEDLKGNPLVWGYDPYNRPFIAFQYQITTKHKEEEEEKETARECSTLFQRYPNELGTVAQGGSKEYYISMSSLRNIPDQIEELRKLFSGDTVVREFRDRTQEFSMKDITPDLPVISETRIVFPGVLKAEVEKHINQVGPIVHTEPRPDSDIHSNV